MENPITSSPTLKPETPEPTSATTPARSLPSPDGKVAGNRASTAPLRITASLMLIPAALTSMRTSPICGTGRGTSRTSRTSTSPYESNCTALAMATSPSELCPEQTLADSRIFRESASIADRRAHRCRRDHRASRPRRGRDLPHRDRQGNQRRPYHHEPAQERVE